MNGGIDNVWTNYRWYMGWCYNKKVSRLDIVRELHGKQITLVFVEEDGNNILGFRYDDTMYVFDSNIN